MPHALTRIVCLVAMLCMHQAVAQPEIDFRRPSDALAELVERRWTPLYNPDPTRKKLLKLEVAPLIPEEVLQREEVHLAGFRMHRETRARSRRLYADGLSFIDIATGVEKAIMGLPAEPIILHFQWSPNGEHIAALLERLGQVELWLFESENLKAHKLSDLAIHAGMDDMLAWSSDGKGIWVKTVPENLAPPPAQKNVERQALVRETTGKPIPAQTHQGVLRTQEEVDQFEYYFTSELTKISLDGSHEMVGEPGVYSYFRESPDRDYLLVERLVKPWSYWVNADQFAYDVEVWDLQSGHATRVTSAPIAEALPYGGGAVRLGAREVAWRSDKSATLVWVEALDRGNPYESVQFRDQILSLEAPFDSAPLQLTKTRGRVGDILWHQTDRALLLTWDWVQREFVVASFNPDEAKKETRRVITFEMGNRYRHPGLPLMTVNEKGFPVVQSDSSGEHIYLIGDGGSLEGDRPFLDKLNLNSKRKKRLFRSRKPYFETPVTILDDAGEELLVRRESPIMPPSFFCWSEKEGFYQQLTFDENPYPELENIQRVLLRYKRRDGIFLTANLYLPAGYNAKKDGPLPTLVWAYPKAYQSAQNASQLKKSPYQFLHGRWNRPILWVSQGYAVLDDPAMPIVAQARGNANDSFIPQLIDSASAAVKELIQRGVSEEGKIALGGHSYGAFMTANLLIHTDLFCAGIARGGAYNRTLTPFGFQSEERNLWQAPKVYLKMSPFINAGHINEPLLLLHGEKDENPGTYPLQSERLFHAMNGLGRQARLVMLPNEAHTFRGEEAVLHAMWEIERWLEIYVKGETPAVSPLISQQDRVVGSAESSSAEGGEK